MIEIFLFIKNEIDFVQSFLDHHLCIADKLTIIDNGSTDGTYEILTDYASKENKINLLRHDCAFQNKAKLLTKYMHQSNSKLLIPLDTDEILAYETLDGQVTTCVETIKNHLKQLSLQNVGKFQIKHIYNYIPDSENYFALDKHSKFIFLRSDFYDIDTGAHKGRTIHNKLIHRTNLVYLHFHFRNFDAWLKSTEQKLRARLGNNWNNIECLLEYKKPRPSYHVALEYIDYLQGLRWPNLKPYKQINHSIKTCQKKY